MGLFGWLGGGALEGIARGASEVGRTFVGDRAQRDAQLSEETIAIINAFAAEFAAPKTTRWDSFVDGLNRLPRPLITLTVLGSFVWAPLDPVAFAETMRALALIPESLWEVFVMVLGFFFGGRIIENSVRKWRVDPRALEVAREIAAERTARRQAEVEAKKAEVAEKHVVIAEKQAEAAQADAGAPAELGVKPSHVVAATLWGEARNEPREGKVAVAWVIRNRVEDPGWWGRTWVGVCMAKGQFSCWWDEQGPKVRSVSPDDPQFQECLAVAEEVMGEACPPDPTKGATHYYAPKGMPGGKEPKWAVGRRPTAVIGGHRFYKIGRSG